MRATPAVGEVTAAIMLTAAFAVAAATLYGAFQERTDAIQTAADHRTDASIAQAAELLVAGPVQCGAGFLLHNYADAPLDLPEITIYTNGTSGITEVAVSFRNLDGDPISILEGGRSAWTNITGGIPCGTDVVLVTPSGRLVRLTV